MHELLTGLLAGNRRTLAQAITLAESTNPNHQTSADQLLDELPPAQPTSIRLGISGTPGVGKSSFIDELGCTIVDAGLRLAVLAVDPSSVATGGSILGDKTRMHRLSQRPEAFIRPSPNSGVLGGVARSTRRAIRLCEAAGHDVVLIETVGIGQSEVSVEAMVDLFVLLIAPGGGDDMQGIKRGVMELVDAVVVNKDDGERRDLAATTASDYESALHLFRPKHTSFSPSVVRCSALERRGVDEVWELLESLFNQLVDDGVLEHRRAEQRRKALWSEVTDRLMGAITAQGSALQDSGFEDVVVQGTRDPGSVATDLLATLLRSDLVQRDAR